MTQQRTHRRWFRLISIVVVLVAVPVILVAGHASTKPVLAQPVASTCALPTGAFSITVCGNTFENQAGQPVVLRGVNTEGTQYDCANSGAGFFDDTTISGTNFGTEIAALKAWGVNVVRVNLNEECWLGINGVPASTSTPGSNGYDAYANVMGSYVAALNAAGIYAEVDLDLNAPGSELIADAGTSDFRNPLPESNSDMFWKSVGAYFASNHAVIFGVFSEPFPPNSATSGDTATGWACDLNGCTVPDYSNSSSVTQIPTATYAGEGMQQMISDIRSVNTTAPLLVGGPDFAGDLDQWLATYYPGGVSIDPDNKLAASVHIYYPTTDSPCTLSTNVATACPGIGQGALTNDGILQVAAVAPVEIDELGDFSCSASSLTPFLSSVDAANANGGVDIGYVGWAWTTSSCDPNLITSYATGAPSPMGTAEYCALFLQGLNNGKLAACSGTPVSTTTTTTTPTPPTTLVAPHGYWLVGSDGGIFSFGSAPFHGSTGNLVLQRPVVGISPTVGDGGYWLVASDGGVFSFGNAPFYGSIPGLGLAPASSTSPRRLNAPIVGMVPSADQKGYFMVGADGGVFSFGDATFEGSCPAIGGCVGAAVAVMPDGTGKGYWIVTKSGHVYSFGDATYYGAPGPQAVAVTSAVRTANGRGYWILLANGTVDAYGNAASLGGPTGSTGGANPASAIFATADGGGYWVAAANGAVFPYGDAPNDGGISGTHLNGAIIAGAGF